MNLRTLFLFFTLTLVSKALFDPVQAFSIQNTPSTTLSQAPGSMRQRCQHNSLPKISSDASIQVLRQSGGNTSSEVKTPTLLMEMIAEFVGTFLIVQIGENIVGFEKKAPLMLTFRPSDVHL